MPETLLLPGNEIKFIVSNQLATAVKSPQKGNLVSLNKPWSWTWVCGRYLSIYRSSLAVGIAMSRKTCKLLQQSLFQTYFQGYCALSRSHWNPSWQLWCFFANSQLQSLIVPCKHHRLYLRNTINCIYEREKNGRDRRLFLMHTVSGENGAT